MTDESDCGRAGKVQKNLGGRRRRQVPLAAVPRSPIHWAPGSRASRPRWVVAAGDAQLAHWQAIGDDPPYAELTVVTACRVWRFAEEGRHCSKAAATQGRRGDASQPRGLSPVPDTVLRFDLRERVWHTDAFPSAADGFYLTGYVPCRTPGRDRASLIDAAIIATGLGLLSWVFLMKPAATDSSLTVVGRIIAIAYPAADVLLLALVARLLVGAGVHNSAFRLPGRLAAGHAGRRRRPRRARPGRRLTPTTPSTSPGCWPMSCSERRRCTRR
jgi:hypothetical protein